MANKTQLLQILQRHVGKQRGIHVKHLAHQLAATERAARKLVAEARADGLPICGTPESGYYLASSQAELDETIAFMQSRVQSSLDQIACLRRAVLPDPFQASLL